jgi:hypothetical protein
MAVAIHLAPETISRIGWDDQGHESGHYATRHEAELTAKPIARQLATKLFIHLPDGRTACRNFAKSWIAKLF